MLDEFFIILKNWETLFITETFIFSIIITIITFSIYKKLTDLSVVESPDDLQQKDNIIKKLKKEKQRLLCKIHDDEEKRDDDIILEIHDMWWSKTGDVEKILNDLHLQTNEMRKKQGNGKLPDEAKAIINGFIKTLKSIL